MSGPQSVVAVAAVVDRRKLGIQVLELTGEITRRRLHETADPPQASQNSLTEETVVGYARVLGGLLLDKGSVLPHPVFRPELEATGLFFGVRPAVREPVGCGRGRIVMLR